jgi:hypothetical protein
MKLWSRIGTLALALAIIAALVLSAAPAVRAAPELTCADVPELCDGFISDSSCVDFFGYDSCLDFCYLLVYDEVGLDCNVCAHVGGFCEVVSCGDAQCEAKCNAAVNSYFACNPDDTCADDGRVNTNCSAPEIVYCNGDKADFYAYNYDTGKGDFDFSIGLGDLQQSVDEKTLVKQDGTVKVYLMPDGRVLLVARQPDGKDYFMYWNPDNCTSLEESAQWGVQ